MNRTLEPRDILAILASCIIEGKKDEPSLDELQVSPDVKNALYDLNELWNDLRNAERKAGAKASEWKLGTFWIGPVCRWIEGGSVAEICAEYDVYEGNLIRTILKLQNMLDEWRSMAEYCEHIDLLETFRDAHELLLREAVIQDSLYLHL